jgi:prephenate dehydrogenase
MELKNLTYGIVGLGIMGGSFAKAIRQNILSQADSSGRILVCNRSAASLNQALKEGIADAAYTSEQVDTMLKECDFVFICLYPHATLNFLSEHINFFKHNALITDISGVKGIFENNLSDIIREDVDFIIAHPMAGGEKEGYSNSDANFFINHNYIICPQNWNKVENLKLMKTLITELGFSRITETSCDIHDAKIGFTSQLCHVIASALVESAEDSKITAFGGGSFEDLTRIAMINAPLWTELFISNKDKLVKHIENFEKQLEIIKNYISSGDEKKLKELLSDTREKRLLMGSILST